MNYPYRPRVVLAGALLTVLLTFSACLGAQPSATPTVSPTPLPSPTASPTRSLTPTITPSQTIDPAHPWLPYAAPQMTPITPIPPPLQGVCRPDEVQVLALLGTDRDVPFVGRTDAILLVIYHPRFSRASLLSLPPDLLVYLPGYGMQRLQVAYALGGNRLLADTLAYNFGLRPNHWVLVHLDSFTRAVDGLGGLDVTVLRPYLSMCGGIPPGTFHMTGQQLLCYLRFRLEDDEADRNRRQQEVFRRLLMRLLQGGDLARLPLLYETFRDTVQTDLNLADLVSLLPLTVRLGDPNRMAFFSLAAEDLETWKIPGELSPQVFLPRPQVVRPLVQLAFNFVLTPAPFSQIVQTLEYQLTVTPMASLTPSLTYTPSKTYTITPSRTLTPSRTFTPSQTFTPSMTFTASMTPTITFTPSITPTGPTPTPSVTPTASTTFTVTMTPSVTP